ncbi:MAG: hypothetical protein JXX28_03210 [Deltaproteobacteria bacterium]|nr:hypothetical protein [Deltaproteobacteria bacterium]
MIALLLLLACPRPSAPEGSLGVGVGAEVVPRVEQSQVGPGPWHEVGGLYLEVPEGWRGWSDASGSLLLSLDHGATGARLELWAFTASEELPGPRPRPGCEVAFLDTARHRSVPLLDPAVIASCEPLVSGGMRVTGWYGQVAGRELHLELLTPPGRSFEAQTAAAPLLAGLGWEDPGQWR